MSMVIARIVLRYLAGALVAYGLVGQDMADQIAFDPQLAEVLGVGIALVTEAAYAWAKARGGDT